MVGTRQYEEMPAGMQFSSQEFSDGFWQAILIDRCKCRVFRNLFPSRGFGVPAGFRSPMEPA
jgi:hypothetical protein